MDLRYPEGATPLDPDSARGLIPALTTQGELNEFESRNIAVALRWARRSRLIKRDLLTIGRLRDLHRRMFNQTWEWAGRFRTVDTNIGHPWQQIPEAMLNLCADVSYRVGHANNDWDDVAIRFHHRLVLIHPFPNGNGRHARIATDLLLQINKQQPFTWGAESLPADGSARREYLAALREADGGAITRLAVFARG